MGKPKRMTNAIGYHKRNALAYAAETAEIDLLAPHRWFLAQAPSGGIVLDAGCGVGRGSAALPQAATPKEYAP
jgi:hypothetical protein